jgi:hypothetical protein
MTYAALLRLLTTCCDYCGIELKTEVRALSFRLPCLFCDTDYHGEGGCHPPWQFFNLSRYVQV